MLAAYREISYIDGSTEYNETFSFPVPGHPGADLPGCMRYLREPSALRYPVYLYQMPARHAPHRFSSGTGQPGGTDFLGTGASAACSIHVLLHKGEPVPEAYLYNEISWK